MKAEALYETTVARLRSYYPFSDATVETVARVAEQQFSYDSYQAFFRAVGVPEAAVYKAGKRRGVPVIDISAQSSPAKGTLVVHLPMANPLDANQLYQVATIAAANPSYRVIGFGNPSGGRFSFPGQNLNILEWLGVATTLNPKPLVQAELAYLHEHNVQNVHHVGFSYGATKAMLSSTYSESGSVDALIMLEPVSHPRSLWRLKNDFEQTNDMLDEYVQRSNLATFIDARNHSVSPQEFREGLARWVSIAIASFLAHSQLSARIKKVFKTQQQAALVLAWGSSSELVGDRQLGDLVKHLSHTQPDTTIVAMRLADQRHAMANDIHLHAALVREALSKIGE